uniref:Uncharacterized protein n=1 Tax=Bionectria ochroleuca TaxID=29856 RepID=A0A0B7JI64_BIOOC
MDFVGFHVSLSRLLTKVRTVKSPSHIEPCWDIRWAKAEALCFSLLSEARKVSPKIPDKWLSELND